MISQANEYYKQSAHLFLGIGMSKEAAKSFYATENFEEAKNHFLKCQMYLEAGQSTLKIIEKNPDKAPLLYSEAITYFEKGNNFQEALQVCNQTNDLERALNIVVKFKSKMLKYHKAIESYLTKFMKELEKKLKSLKVVNKDHFEKLIGIFQKFDDSDLRFNKKTITRKIAENEIKNINFTMYNEVLQQKNDDIFLIFHSMKEFQCFNMGRKFTYLNKMKESHVYFFFSMNLQSAEFRNSISKSFFFERNKNQELACVEDCSFAKDFNDLSLLKMNSVISKLVLLAPNLVFNFPNEEKKIEIDLQQISSDFKTFKNLKSRTLFKEFNGKVINIFKMILQNDQTFIQRFIYFDEKFHREKTTNPSVELCDNIITFFIEICNHQFLPEFIPENIEIIKAILDVFEY